MSSEVITELLKREFISGTSVTNCMQHMGMKPSERPDDCRLCRADLHNLLAKAIRVNEWLNTWKDDATKVLKEL